MDVQTIAPDTCVVRDTASRKGRTRAVEPGRTASRYLHYGRIILDSGDAPIRFEAKSFAEDSAGAGRTRGAHEPRRAGKRRRHGSVEAAGVRVGAAGGPEPNVSGHAARIH